MQTPACSRASSARQPRRALSRWSAAVLLAAVTCAAALPARVHAQAATAVPPTKVSYQGFVTDVNGVPLGNTAPVNRTVIFRLFDAPAGGTRLWSSQQTVTIDKGHFSVLLGEGSPVASEVSVGDKTDLTAYFVGAGSSDRFLELQVEGANTSGVPLAPRLQFLSVPFAFHARVADEVDAVGLTKGLIPSARLVNVDGSGLVQLNASNVASGTLADARLSTNVARLNASQSFSGINTFGGRVEIKNSQPLQFGSDVAGRDANAGAIAYNTTGGTLDIGGAGTTAASRKVRLLADGGVESTGPVKATSFAGFGITPIGGIIMWSGDVGTIPAGWALCNGQTVGTVKTPNLTDRFILGAGQTYTVGKTGGANQVTLKVENLPPHRHSYDDAYFISKSGDWKGGGSNTPDNTTGSSGTNSKNTGSAGGVNNAAQPVDVTPPYYALAFIMRVQ